MAKTAIQKACEVSLCSFFCPLHHCLFGLSDHLNSCEQVDIQSGLEIEKGCYLQVTSLLLIYIREEYVILTV